MRGLALIPLLIAIPLSTSVAQDGAQSLAATLDTYVFPADGQDSSQQSKDEVECYEWAVSNVGSDPFDMAEQSEQQAQQTEQQMQQAEESTRGAGARGAVGGAAAGALIGEIASDDPGEGAAIGAAVGGIAARRRARYSSQEAQQQAAQQGQQQQQATQAEIDNFKKAFSVCLEAKDYMVKF